MHKRFVLMSVIVAGLSILSPQAAHAWAKSAYDVSYCSSGTYQGVGTNALSNGTLRMGWCKSGSEVRTVTIRYDKTLGSAVTIKLGWRTTNGDASEVGPIHWDSSSNDWGTVSPGQSWSYRESPAAELVVARQCVQGVMSDGTRRYYTHNVC